MAQAASKILGTVNAPYGANLSACQFAERISDVRAAQTATGPVFSFFSEISPEQQSIRRGDGPVRAQGAQGRGAPAEILPVPARLTCRFIMAVS